MTEKTLPEQTKSFDAELIKAADSKYDATFVMSSTAPDRMQDTFDINAYKNIVGKKLLALFGHNSEKILGYWENIRVEGNKLFGDISIAPTGLGKFVKALIDHKTPLMSSVGFAPRDYEQNDLGGLHFKEVDWMECSVVAVGCHQDANMLKMAKEFGIDLESTEEDPPVASDHNSDLAKEAVSKAKAAILAANQIVRKYS